MFFRNQHNLTDTLQKQITHRLGQLSGKPADSTLHIHPMVRNTEDILVSTLSSVVRKKRHPPEQQRSKMGRRYDAGQWHADTQWEIVPADYISLRLAQLPKTGGDTLWASGYEMYDRFSQPYQKLFESLTVTCIEAEYLKMVVADPENVSIYDKPRGNPLNTGTHVTAVHPVVRTNPVSGWKSIVPVGASPKRINELNLEESDELLQKFYTMILENHDLTVRFKWRNENDFGTFSSTTF